MSRRRRILLTVLASLVLLGVSGWLASSGSDISPANAARIKPGMTLAEVQEILGGPPRNETGGRFLAQTWIKSIEKPVGLENDTPAWYGPTCTVIVAFDFDGRSIDYALAVDTAFYESMWGRLCRWLGLYR